MGMIRHRLAACLALASLCPTVALAQDADAGSVSAPAVGTEIFVSSDSDDTNVVRMAIDFDLRNAPGAERFGIRLEKAWLDPNGLGTVEQERVFVQLANRTGDWNWAARVGTDGDSIIGSASINDNSRFRKEAFVEREIIDTPVGLSRGLYATFVGAAIDLPADDRNTLTALVGLQEFTGDNVRLHLRANYVHVVKEEWGLSAQLRGRYFHNSVPGEFDYYSPEEYGQILPVVQIRRHLNGWQFLAAGGVGIQRASNTDWEQSNFAQLRFVSPVESAWTVSGEAIYSQTPANTALSGQGYAYFQTRLSIARRF